MVYRALHEFLSPEMYSYAAIKDQPFQFCSLPSGMGIRLLVRLDVLGAPQPHTDYVCPKRPTASSPDLFALYDEQR